MRSRSSWSALIGLLTLISGVSRGQVAPGPGGAASRDRGPADLGKMEVRVGDGASGPRSALEREIAAQFSRQTLLPRERTDEYAWAYPRPADPKAGPGIKGWWGTIASLSQTPEGWVVRVAVWPRLASGATAVRPSDDGAYVEEYLYSDRQLKFRKAITPRHPGRPLVMTW